MTDKQIMQALNCCTSKSISCQKCTLLCKSKCERELIRHSFELINRQQAEIEKARAEAIKEFADRLKAEHSTPDMLMPFNWISIEDTALDEIVKEMVGAEDD